MEYLVFIAAVLAFAAFVIAQGIWSDKKNQKLFLIKLKKLRGNPPDKEYKPERYVEIPAYFEAHPESGQLDDITWNDLGMDDIFQRMDYSLSSTGEEYLYYLLRSPGRTEAELAHFEGIIEYYRTHEEERIRLQCLMAKMGSTGKNSLYRYLEYLTRLGQRSNGKEILCDLLFLPCIGILFVNLSVGILAIALLMLYNIMSYFKVKKEIDPYLVSLAYIMRLADTAGQLQTYPGEAWQEERERLREYRGRLSRFRHGPGWAMNMGAFMGTGGNPLELLMDYVRMLLHVDIIAFNRMLKEVLGHLEDIDGLAGVLGYLESAVCVGLFRDSLMKGWCVPEFGGKTLKVEECYHPLLKDPVKNSIMAGRGVLLTGSNASGKSTFLKTVALNALMAQTVHTVTADSYQAPICRIYSSMSLRDDLESGESYYIVEIKSIKRILSAVREENMPVLCFVDEVLRGTNTVERIAASTQILKSMAAGNCICFAATHDIELTGLLQGLYDNYHFEEEIEDGDVFFSYKLHSGRAASQNAIRLLGIMGYDESIVERAMRQAELFKEQGVWKPT